MQGKESGEIRLNNPHHPFYVASEIMQQNLKKNKNWKRFLFVKYIVCVGGWVYGGA